MKFYCYVYYDENWQAYYVGKGVGRRVYRSHNHPELPLKERIQRFDFDYEWQTWECEIELIAFWGRQCDGGTLLNKSTGGRGGNTGVVASAETRAKLSASRKGRKHSAETKAKIGASHKGRQRSAEHSAKLAKSNTGRKVSAETRAKLSAAMKGKQNARRKKS